VGDQSPHLIGDLAQALALARGCLTVERSLSAVISLDDRDLYSGLIRLHILHHAVKGPVFGLGMAEELARHGYRISAGTLYPLLHGLERKGYLHATEQRGGKTRRKVYQASS
jgi:hypothetical protein